MQVAVDAVSTGGEDETLMCDLLGVLVRRPYVAHAPA